MLYKDREQPAWCHRTGDVGLRLMLARGIQRMAMERIYLLALALPLLLLTSSFWKDFLPKFPKPALSDHHDISPKVQDFPSGGIVDPVSLGGKFHISFCTSCSYKKAATQFKNTLRAAFPENEVILSNYQPEVYKRWLHKLVTTLQIGGIVLAVAGDHVLARLGYATPPSWYATLKQNRFGTIASTLLIGNAVKSALYSTGAFEIYYDGDLVFSKLQEKRFPNVLELDASLSKFFERKKVQRG